MAKKQRTDTAKGKVQSMANATAAKIVPPEEMLLSDAEIVKFDRIIDSRAADKWDAVDIERAANLARCHVEIDEIQAELKSTGRTSMNDRGTIVANPLQGMLDAAVRRSITLGRSIHTHTEAKHGKARDQRPHTNAANDAKSKVRKSNGKGKVSLIKMPA